MIVLLQTDADRATIEALMARLSDLGLEAAMLDGSKGRALEILGDDRGRALALRGAPGVREILTRRLPLEGGEPIWPHFALRLGILSLLLLTVLVLLTAWFPPGLGDAAHPDTPRAGHAVEWYLRPAAGLVALAPEGAPWIAGVIGFLLWGLLLVWPFLDGSSSKPSAGFVMLRFVGALVALGVVLLGVFS
ncbi:MAG: hypothetical protein ACYTG2_10335 [Planctomycetota bacterium]|jgi:hypothetical protein